jgi:hypothetical protein
VWTVEVGWMYSSGNWLDEDNESCLDAGNGSLKDIANESCLECRQWKLSIDAVNGSWKDVGSGSCSQWKL